MATAAMHRPTHAITPPGQSTTEPRIVRVLLIGTAMVFLTLFLFAPLAIVFVEALGQGIAVYLSAIGDQDALFAILLTVTTALIVVPLNTLFGVAAAWSIAKFRFVGRSVLITFIDLPFAVSPVISGMIFVLLFGAQGLFEKWLQDRDVQIIFAAPGIFLATVVHVHSIGPVARIELEREDTGDIVEAHLTKERQRELTLRVGEIAYFRPRNLRVFLEEMATPIGR